MVPVKDLTQLALRDLWREVEDEDEGWGETNQQTLNMVKLILEGSLEEELLGELQPARHRRSKKREALS